MSLTALLDLDDTLLVNPMDSFLPAYLQSLSGWLKEYAPPEKIIQSLLTGTRRMVKNAQPGCALRDVFDAEFFPSLGVSRERMQADIDRFYVQAFPQIKEFVHPMPGAVETVERLLAMGARLAIATNPLFPLSAIRQRLEWAGLDPARYPFAVIPSYETFHFAKPNPAFLAELLGRMGWPEGPVVMVGDRLEHDAAPARGLGIPFYHVNPAGPPEDGSPGGPLDALPAWLESCPEESLLPDYEGIAAIRATLASTPAVLAHWLTITPPERWRIPSADGGWPLGEALCHWRDVEAEVYLPRLEKTLQQKNPFLPGIDTGAWGKQRGYHDQDARLALDDFLAVRMKALSRLDALTPEDWERPARHAIFGNTTLREMADFNARHDRLHLHELFNAGIIP